MNGDFDQSGGWEDIQPTATVAPDDSQEYSAAIGPEIPFEEQAAAEQAALGRQIVLDTQQEVTGREIVAATQKAVQRSAPQPWYMTPFTSLGAVSRAALPWAQTFKESGVSRPQSYNRPGFAQGFSLFPDRTSYQDKAATPG